MEVVFYKYPSMEDIRNSLANPRQGKSKADMIMREEALKNIRLASERRKAKKLKRGQNGS